MGSLVSADLDAVSFGTRVDVEPKRQVLYGGRIPDVSVDFAVYGMLRVSTLKARLNSAVWPPDIEIVLSVEAIAVLVSPSFELDRFFMDTSLLPGH